MNEKNTNDLKKRLIPPTHKEEKKAFEKLHSKKELNGLELSYIINYVCKYAEHEEQIINYFRSFNIPKLNINEVAKKVYELGNKELPEKYKTGSIETKEQPTNKELSKPTLPRVVITTQTNKIKQKSTEKIQNDTLLVDNKEIKAEVKPISKTIIEYDKRIIPTQIPYIKEAYEKLKKREELTENEIEKIVEDLYVSNSFETKDIFIYLTEYNHPDIKYNIIKDILTKKYNYKDETEEKMKKQEIKEEIRKGNNARVVENAIFECPYCNYKHTTEDLILSKSCISCRKLNPNKPKKWFRFSKIDIINSIYEYITSKYHIISIKEKQNINTLFYNEETGLYEEIILLLKKVGLLFNSLWDTSIEKDLRIKIRNSSDLIEENELNPSNIVGLNNKVLFFNEKTREIEILPFSHEYYITQKITWNYSIPENLDVSPCPVFENEYLNSVIEPEWVSVLWDLIGYSLWKSQALKKFVVIQGSKDSGKSQFCKILEHLFSGFTTRVQIKHLVKDDYSFTFNLKNALINITNDEKKEGLLKNAIEVLKNIVGGDGIYSRQHYGMGQNLDINTLFFLVCNKMYRLDLNDESITSKFILLVFPYEFVENPIYKHQKERIPDMYKRMTTKQEMEGILYLAVERTKKLFKEGNINLPFTEEEMFKRIEHVENPIERNWKELIEYSPGSDAVLIEIQERFISSKHILKIPDDERIDNYTEFKKAITETLNKYVRSEGFAEEVVIKRARIKKNTTTDGYESDRGLILKDFQLKQNWVKKYREKQEKEKINYIREEETIKPKSLAEKQYDAKQKRNYAKGAFQSGNEPLTECIKEE